MSILGIIVNVAAFGGAFMVALLALRSRYRRIWSELFRTRQQLTNLDQTIIELRKELALTAVSSVMRLPPAMPSQHGEDLLLWNFFGRKRDGFYIEIGAFDGVAFSNTYFFEAIGWTGILIEASPLACLACVSARPHSQTVHAAVGRENGTVRFSLVEGAAGVATLSSSEPDPAHLARIQREGGTVRQVEVPQRTMNDILADVTRPIDFVSIDVEGGELDVLAGFDLARFRPRVLLIEDNSNGADRRVTDFLAPLGYAERYRLEQNVFYTQHADFFAWSARIEGSEHP